MRNITTVAAAAVATAMLAACSSYPMGPTYSSYPATTTSYPVASYPAAGTEYGRIVNIEYLPVGSTAPHSGIIGAVVGGLAGAALGSVVGAGAGRTAATVLGGVAGATVGNQIGRNHEGATTQAGYRITMQTEGGAIRTFEVPATGDLRVGDRVRVDNGVIYRG